MNLLAGILAVRFAFVDDQPRKAGYSVLIGFVLGDLLDGHVARRTGTANRVGAELDTLVDHFVHVVVPGLILLEIFNDGDHGWLGLAVLAVLVGAATVRHARLAAVPFRFAACWCGLPRTISGFAAMGIVLSRAFDRGATVDYWLASALIVLLATLNVVPVPYRNHRGRPLSFGLKVLIGLFVLTPLVTFGVDRPFTFDVFTAWILGYALLGWVPFAPDDRSAFYLEYRRWHGDLATTV